MVNGAIQFYEGLTIYLSYGKAPILPAIVKCRLVVSVFVPFAHSQFNFSRTLNCNLAVENLLTYLTSLVEEMKIVPWTSPRAPASPDFSTYLPTVTEPVIGRYIYLLLTYPYQSPTPLCSVGWYLYPI